MSGFIFVDNPLVLDPVIPPDGTLDVQGNLTVTGFISGNSTLAVVGSITTQDRLYLKTADGTLRGTLGAAQGEYDIVAGTSMGNIGFATTNQPIYISTTDGTTAQIIVSATGKVGLGIAPGTSILRAAGVIESTTGGYKFPDGTTQTTAAVTPPAGGGTINTLPLWATATTLADSPLSFASNTLAHAAALSAMSFAVAQTWTFPNNAFGLIVTGATGNKVVIDTGSGYLGVNPPSSPAAPLHVEGNIAAPYELVRLRNSRAGTDSHVTIQTHANATGALTPTGQIQNVTTALTPGSGTYDWVFKLVDSAGTLQERLRIDSASKVIFQGTAVLAAGTTTVAPLRFAAGVVLTSPVFGSVEFDGTSVYVTNNSGSPTRKTIAYTDSSITGNAATATALQTARNFSLSGNVTATAVSFNGTADVVLSTTIATGVIVDSMINASAGIVDTKLATISTAGKVANSATTATSVNTASTIVLRDASGNFAAGTITADITGNAGTVTNGVYTTGSYANPTWLTSLAASKLTGTVAIANGGTGQATQQAAINALVSVVTSGYYLRGNGTNALMSALLAADLTGTIPAGVLGNSTVYVGTTAIALNRASAVQSLTGVSIDGNAGTVTNGVYTSGSYADPTWLTSLAGSKISGNISGNAANVTGVVALLNGGTGATTAAGARTNLGLVIGTDVPSPTGSGASGTWNISISGNAATVTNGVYTTGSYADPTWLTSLAGSKITGNISGNAANVTGVVAIANGGTGQTTASAARGALLPSYVGNTLKFLRVNAGGTDVEWASEPNVGTVTSINVSGGTTGLTFSGGPITTSGTITMAGTLGFANGGTGQATQQAAINALAGAVTAAYYLRGNGTNVVMAALAAADLTGTIPSGVLGTSVLYVGTTSIALNRASAAQTLTGISIDGNAGTVTNGVYTTGAYADPTWITSLAASKLTGTVAIANGGTGQSTQQAALNALAGAVTSGQYLRGNGTNVLMSAIQAADVPTLNQNTTGTAANVTGVVAVVNGGTGQTSYTDGQLLIGNTVGNTLTKTTLTAGSGVTISNGNGSITISATGLGGTVTSVGVSGGTTGLTFSNSPITTSGTMTLSGTLAVANGGSGATTLTGYLKGNGTSAFTASATIPGADVSGNISGNAANVTGVVAILNGGTGATTQQAAINALAGATTAGQFLRGSGTNVVMSAIQVSDVPTLNQNTTGTAANVTGIVAIANGGSGQTTAQAALNAFAGAVTSAYYLRGNGTNVLMSALAAADLTGTIPAGVLGNSSVFIGTTSIALNRASAAQTLTGVSIDGNAGTVTNGVYTSGSYANPTWITSLAASKLTGTVAIANGGTALSTTPTNGQLLIGNTTGSNYTLATLTPGTGISVTNGAGSITISVTGLAVLSVAGDSGTATPSSNSFTIAGGVGLTSTGAGSTITLDLDNTAVTAAAYGSASQVATFTVDQQGRLTAAASTSINITASQVSNFDTQVRTSRLDQMAAPTTSLSLNSQRIINLADPVGAQDAATKSYVDSTAQGLDVKGSVKAATTASITLSGAQTIDGVSLVAGDRCLVKNQSPSSDNGIYIVSASGWTRSPDMDAWSEIPGAFTFVEQGTTLADTGWVCTADQGGTLGVTAITFTQFSGAGSYTAGNGLTLTGTSFSVVGTANRISVSGAGVDIASTYVGQTSLTTLGTITTGTWNASTMGVAYGGTGLTTTPTNGQLLVGNGSGYALATITAGANISVTNGAGSITVAATGVVTSVSATGPIASSGGTTPTISLGTVGTANGGTGLTATPTNGQLLIGNGTGYTLASITAGAGITVTPGAGSITIATTAPSGSGTVNTIPRWTTSSNLGDSLLSQNTTTGNAVFIGTQNLVYPLANRSILSIDGTSSALVGFTIGGTGQGYINVGSGSMYVISQGVMYFGGGGAVGVTLTSGNNVGIGTSSPGSKLDVVGDLRVATTTGFNTYFTQPLGGGGVAFVSTVDPTLGTERLFSLGFGSLTYPSQVRIEAVATEIWSSTARGSALRFNTTANGATTSAERVRIDHNGNVGINTASPGATLHVNGTGLINGLRVEGSSGWAGRTGGLELEWSGTQSYVTSYNRSASSWQPLIVRGSIMVLQTAGLDRLYITAGGDVGIGNSSPAYKLDVTGSVRVGADLNENGKTSHYEGYTVAPATYVPINLSSGVNTLTAGYVYRVVLIVPGTGTDTGAVYTVRQTAATTWGIWRTSANTDNSNNPSLRVNVAGTGLEVFHNHASGTYTILTRVEQYYTQNVTRTAATIFGLENGVASNYAGVLAVGTDANVTTNVKLYVSGKALITSNFRRPDDSGDVLFLGNGTETHWQDTYIFNNAAGSTEFARLNSTGLGIGTASPAEKLHVYGTSSTYGRVETTGAAAVAGFYTQVPTYGIGVQLWSAGGYSTTRAGITTPGWNFLEASSGNGLVITATNSAPLVFGTNNAERVRITSGGNVGIGETNPQTKLHITNTLAGAQTDKSLFVIYDMFNAGANGQYYQILGGSNGINLIANWGPLSLGARQDSTAAFRQTITITTTDLVGVGTTSPAAKIHSSVADGVNYSLGLSGTTKALRVTHNSTETRVEGVDNTLSASYQPLILGGSVLAFNTNGSTRAMTIDTSQRVGIGTGSPTVRLDVSGAVKADYGVFTSGLAAYASTGALYTYFSTTVGAIASVADNAGTRAPMLFTGSYFSFTAATELMRIDTTGNVGINITPNAAYKLHVNGSIASWDGTNGRVVIVPSGSAATGYIEWRVGTSGNRLGYIGSNTTDMFVGLENSANFVVGGGNLLPNVDNTQTLGSATKRWSAIYAGALVTDATVTDPSTTGTTYTYTLTSGQSGIFTATKTVATATSTQFFTVDVGNGAHCFDVTFVVSESGFSVAKKYTVAAQYGLTTATITAFKIVDTGPYTGNDLTVTFSRDGSSGTKVICSVQHAAGVNANVAMTLNVAATSTGAPSTVVTIF